MKHLIITRPLFRRFFCEESEERTGRPSGKCNLRYLPSQKTLSSYERCLASISIFEMAKEVEVKFKPGFIRIMMYPQVSWALSFVRNSTVWLVVFGYRISLKTIGQSGRCHFGNRRLIMEQFGLLILVFVVNLAQIDRREGPLVFECGVDGRAHQISCLQGQRIHVQFAGQNYYRSPNFY